MDAPSNERDVEKFVVLLRALLESNVITDTESNVPRWTADKGFMTDTIQEDLSFFWIMSTTYDEDNPFPLIRFISRSGERGFGVIDWPSALDMPSMEVYSLEQVATAIAKHQRAELIRVHIQTALENPSDVDAYLLE